MRPATHSAPQGIGVPRRILPRGKELKKTMKTMMGDLEWRGGEVERRDGKEGQGVKS